jgi:hypothetical protein
MSPRGRSHQPEGGFGGLHPHAPEVKLVRKGRAVNRIAASRNTCYDFIKRFCWLYAGKAVPMNIAVALIVGVFTGGSIAFLCGTILFFRWRLGRRRSLASGFIGEIVAVLRALETRDVVAQLGRLAVKEGDRKQSAYGLELPPCVVYQANIRRLIWFRSPLPREIVYFYTKMAGVAEELRALAGPAVPTDTRVEFVRSVMVDIGEVFELGDALLRRLRPLVSKRRSSSISRA